MQNVVIVSGARTPIGRYGGSLREVPVPELGALVLNAALERAGIEPGQVEDVIVGQSYQNGECANAGRFALLSAGWPESVPALTLDRRCCSGVDAVLFGVMKIQTGNAEVVVAGGMESMSRAELYLPGDIKWGLGGRVDPKWGFMPGGHGALAMWGIPFYDRIQRARVMSQPISRYGELNSMMSWAENAARAEGITRQAADEWSARSHARAVAAQREGRFAAEIVPVPLPGKKGEATLFAADETPRPDTTVEKLAKLKPVYPDGVCTAGNSSSINDGAAALLVLSAERARELGAAARARILSWGITGCAPELMGMGPVASTRLALERAGLTLGDLDVIEINEAFAAQVLAVGRDLDWDWERVNPHGGAVALGHPLGASGGRLLVMLLRELDEVDGRYGLATACIGGGQGISVVVERLPR
jgi:acetyl-CoA C-acetyltransferase